MPTKTIGYMVVLEGGEGSGKSSALQAIGNALAGLFPRREIIRTREPGGSKTAEAIRKILVSKRNEPMPLSTELLLFAAARASHVERTIRPALAKGAIVLSDRFSLSTEAYQGAGHGADFTMLETVDAFARQGLQPDLTLVLDIDPRIGLARSQKRATDATHFESLGNGFHDRVREHFRMKAASHPDVVLVDANRNLGDVHQTCLSIIISRMQAKAAEPTAG